MNQRAEYLIQILDKIGAPLLGAAEHSGNETETATIVASLLGKVVETSISMNQTLDLNATDSQDDSLRVALAALAGSLVANQYKRKGKMPEAADLSRVQSAMSAVLTFADNFTLSDDHVERLKKIRANGGVVDAHQISIQYVDALIPVINAVGAFPFGQPEQKLIMDVSDRLVRRTAEMREVLLPDLSGDDEKLAELAILRATANIYAACHEAETQRLTGNDSEPPASISIAPVWEAFETRTSMLESVAKNLMPQSKVGAALKPQITEPEQAPPAPAPVVEAPPSEQSAAPPPIFQSKPAASAPAEQPASPPVAETPPAGASTPAQAEPEKPAANTSGASPMGFFKKPNAAQAEPKDDSVSPPLAKPETIVPPAAQVPVTPAPETPPAPPPPPQAETETDKSDDDSSTDSSGKDDSGSNPMSFFGKKG